MSIVQARTTKPKPDTNSSIRSSSFRLSGEGLFPHSFSFLRLMLIEMERWR